MKAYRGVDGRREMGECCEWPIPYLAGWLQVTCGMVKEALQPRFWLSQRRGLVGSNLITLHLASISCRLLRSHHSHTLTSTCLFCGVLLPYMLSTGIIARQSGQARLEQIYEVAGKYFQLPFPPACRVPSIAVLLTSAFSCSALASRHSIHAFKHVNNSYLRQKKSHSSRFCRVRERQLHRFILSSHLPLRAQR